MELLRPDTYFFVMFSRGGFSAMFQDRAPNAYCRADEHKQASHRDEVEHQHRLIMQQNNKRKTA
jgi:hypothetical protein